MDNKNINVKEEDIKRLTNAITFVVFIGFPIILPIILVSLFLCIVTIPLISTKVFALPFAFLSLIATLIIFLINRFKKKENRTNILLFLGFFLFASLFSAFQVSRIKIDKENKLKVETEIIQNTLYLDPYKKIFDDDSEFNKLKYIVDENMSEYQFKITAKTPKDLEFSKYIEIGFDEDNELDFIEKIPYNEALIIKYYYKVLKEGLKDGKIYLQNFDTTEEIIIEANSETIELIKRKSNM